METSFQRTCAGTVVFSAPDPAAGHSWPMPLPKTPGDSQASLAHTNIWIELNWIEVAQLCPTLCDPMDCNLQGSSVHGILQARILEWVAISISRGSSQPRDRTLVAHIVGRYFTIWEREASHLVWPQVNSREGTQLHPWTENWFKDLLSITLPIRTRPSFPLSQSLQIGSFNKPLILLHQRADRLKPTPTEN